MDKRIKNQFWKERSKHGRDKIFESPELLFEEACKYFQWCDEHPLQEEKVFGTKYKTKVDLMRAYTLQGLCLFLGITIKTWQRYRKRPDFSDKVEEIEMIIYDQKFTGAAVNLLNANIISRDLGLIDKQEHTLDRKQGDLSALTDDELQIYYDLQKKIENGQHNTPGIIQTPEIQLHYRAERSESQETGGSFINTD
jgi:hypothetical protein